MAEKGAGVGDAEKTELKTRLRLVVMVEVGGIVGGLMGMHCVQPAIGSTVIFFIDGPSFQVFLAGRRDRGRRRSCS